MSNCTWCEEDYKDSETVEEDGDKVCIYCHSAYEAHQHRDAMKIAI